MQWSRIAFAFMLILALVPAVSVISTNVSGQGYVTITTQTTTTGLYTYAATTRNETETTSSYVYGPADFALSICGIKAHQIWVFDAIKGHRYHVEWTTGGNISLDFYITAAFVGATHVGCSNFPGNYQAQIVYHRTGAAGQGDWVAPSTGLFIAWIWNFSLDAVSGTWSIQTPATTTVPVVGYVTASTAITITELHTLTTAVSQAGLPFGNLGLLAASAVVAIIACVLVVARRRKPSLAATLTQEHPATVQESPRDAVALQPVTQTKLIQAQPVNSTGYVDLDKALDGGIPEKFSVVIVSPSFDERDLLLRKVVQSALSSGKLAIFVSNDIGRTEDLASRYPKGFYALSPQADKISSYAPNLLNMPKIENLSDASLTLSLTIKDVLAKENKPNPIIIIDILSDVLLRHKSVTTRRWLSDFVGKRKAEGFTILATLNPLTTTKEETQTIIDFFDGVIEIYEKPLMERSRRFLIIKKMYGRRYSENEVLMDKDKLF